jgi:hypothetical protein
LSLYYFLGLSFSDKLLLWSDVCVIVSKPLVASPARGKQVLYVLYITFTLHFLCGGEILFWI